MGPEQAEEVERMRLAMVDEICAVKLPETVPGHLKNYVDPGNGIRRRWLLKIFDYVEANGEVVG